MLLTVAGTALAAQAGAPELSSSTGLTREGYFVLNWSTEDPAGDDYVLQQSNTPGFENPFERSISPSGQITISGLDDGTYYFRAGPAGGGGWSNTVEVRIEHWSLSRALGFFSLGLVLFAALIGTIVYGNRRSRRDPNAV